MKLLRFISSFGAVLSLSCVALAVPKASPKPASKTYRVKSVSAALNPKTAPGRMKVPVVAASNSIPGRGTDELTVKMKPAKASRAVATSSSSNGGSKSNAKSVSKSSAKPFNPNEPVSSYVRLIRASQSPQSPTLAQGSALAIHDSFFVTSTDFVADTWTNSGEVKFYVGDVVQPLQLVVLDVAANIAVFSTGANTRLEQTLPLQRLRLESPSLSEDLTSYNMNLGSLVSGGGVKRAPSLTDLSITREQVELPVSLANAGTQFLFDRSNRWVGLTSTFHARDGRKYDLASASQAHEMIRLVEQRPLKELSSSTLQTQSLSWQERWTNMFQDSVRKGVALKNLSCAAEALKISDAKLASELVRTRLMRCRNYNSISLTRDYTLGFEIVSGDVTYTHDVRTFLTHDSSPTTVFGSQFFGNRDRTVASINVLTSPECEKSDVTNGRGHHFHVRFCTSSLKNAPALTDTTMTVISSDTGVKSNLNSVHLRGFDAKNAKRIMQWLIEAEVVQ